MVNTPRPTPQIIYVVITPTPSETASPSNVAGPTPTRPSASETPAATPTPPPAGATRTPFPLISGLTGSTCSGNPANDEWFHSVAQGLLAYHDTWQVYCAVLPSGWSIRTHPAGANVDYNHGGHITVDYVGPHGQTLTLDEGNFCSGAACAGGDVDLGTATFAALAGHMYTYSADLVLYVNPGTRSAYRLFGHGISQSTFRHFAASFIEVYL